MLTMGGLWGVGMCDDVSPAGTMGEINVRNQIPQFTIHSSGKSLQNASNFHNFSYQFAIHEAVV